ncbi:MAG: UDP-N-acetylmuramoyl-L-alanine--D-glutamate ligase [Acidobacteria bacterium]|nr:UDP-N-acetylmuramoyl-L-alanine--D-glutamate ligase [Acidobacteriota bacterium]
MELKDQRALVVGLARTGAATARFLAARGARVTVSELRPESTVAADAAALRALGVRVSCGGHEEADFLATDLIVLSPGVPLTLPALLRAREKGIEIISELELAWRFLRGTVVAVTGSNGKTTTTALLGKLFAHAGRRVQVGGNIGTPLISLVDTARDDTVNLVEVSSFQLEAITSFRPRVAALLNLTPDHLDRHATMSDYVAAKARLFGYQQKEDFAIFNADDSYASQLAPEVRAQRFWFSRQRRLDVGTFLENGWIVYADAAARERVLTRDDVRLKGEHNLENVLAAVCAARLLAVPAENIRAAVATFEGVEHRLEFVTEINGVSYYNDSKATNVDAALKAIHAFPGGLIVILGGKDKGGDFRPLRDALRQRARHVLLIGAAREKMAAQLADGFPTEMVETLGEAVQRAAALAVPGDVVLLAPACASFDQFENYEHRGRVFKEEVQRLAGKRAS